MLYYYKVQIKHFNRRIQVLYCDGFFNSNQGKVPKKNILHFDTKCDIVKHKKLTLSSNIQTIFFWFDHNRKIKAKLGCFHTMLLVFELHLIFEEKKACLLKFLSFLTLLFPLIFIFYYLCFVFFLPSLSPTCSFF